jgi:hypothetical protein
MIINRAIRKLALPGGDLTLAKGNEILLAPYFVLLKYSVKGYWLILVFKIQNNGVNLILLLTNKMI